MEKKGSSLLKAGSYSLLSYGAQLGLAFVSFLVLIRLLPEYDFGVWVLFMTVTSFAEMGRIGLTQNAVVKFCVEDANDYGAVATAGFWLNSVCSVGLGLLLVLLGWPLSKLWSAPELPSLLWWYLPFALLHGTARYFDFLHMANHDFKGVFWSKLIFGLVFLMLIVTCWRWLGGIQLWHLPILQVLAAVPSLLVFAVYRRRYLRWDGLQWTWVKKLFHFGKYVLGTNFSSMFFNKVDIMMLGAFMNPAAVAIYNVATRITNYMEVPMSGIAQAIYPRLASANREGGKEQVGLLYERSVGLLLAILVPMAIVVLGLAEPIVVLLAGPAYKGAVPMLNILIFAVVVKPWGRLFGITLDAIGRPKLNFYLLLLGLVLNIILNMVLITMLGMRGAAWASLLSIWVMVVTGQVLIQRIIPISQKNIFQRMFAFYRQPMAELKLKN